jgi:hypothetical protein
MGIRYILLPCAGIIFPVRVGRGRSYLVSSLDADQVLMMRAKSLLIKWVRSYDSLSVKP